MASFLVVSRLNLKDVEHRERREIGKTADRIRLMLGCAIASCRGNPASDAIVIMTTGTTSGPMQ